MGKRGATAWQPPDLIRRDKDGKETVVKGWEEFNNLCAVQSTLSELAAHYDISPDTIERAVKRTHKVKFAEYYRQKKKKGHISLRRKMFQMAIAGDKTMLIWLSKQHLKFSEKMTVREPKKKDDAPLATSVNSLELLERLLSEMKPAPADDRGERLGLIAKRLGIEK